MRAFYARSPTELALADLLAHLPELWGDDVREGQLTLKVDAEAVDAALAVLRQPHQQGDGHK